MSHHNQCAGWRGRPPKKRSSRVFSTIDKGTPEFQKKAQKYARPLDQLRDLQIITRRLYRAGMTYCFLKGEIYRALQIARSPQSHATRWGMPYLGRGDAGYEDPNLVIWRRLMIHLKKRRLTGIADYLVEERLHGAIDPKTYPLLRRTLEEIADQIF